MTSWLFVIAGLLLAAATALAALVAFLELYGRLRPSTVIRYDRRRRTPWREESAPLGERRWSARLPFTNSHRADQGLLLDARADVQWLLAGGASPHGLNAQVSLVMLTEDGRQDGYFAASTVEPGGTAWVSAEVIARGPSSDLERLTAGLVRLHYRIYTRHSDLHHEAEIILPVLSAEGHRSSVEMVEYGGTRMLPLRTHLITEDDDLSAVVELYARPHLNPGDVVVLVESAVAYAQGRYFSPSELHPGWLATRLCHFLPLRGSLGTRYTLQALMIEHGTLRVLAAALIGTASKLIGLRGLFYRIAGEQARLIDDLSGTLPPFDRMVVLGPLAPDQVVREIESRTGIPVAIVDANDLREAYVLAASPGVDTQRLAALMRANPQGNDCQQTPLVLVRPDLGAAEQVA